MRTRPEPVGFPPAWYDRVDGVLAGKRGYNSRMLAALSSRERAKLKARAHPLEPVVRIGHAGVTAELVAEVDRALSTHELIKVSIAAPDRHERVRLGDALAERVDAAPVHRVGKILILWRPRPC
jgi:RNA-binding protein